MQEWEGERQELRNKPIVARKKDLCLQVRPLS